MTLLGFPRTPCNRSTLHKLIAVRPYLKTLLLVSLTIPLPTRRPTYNVSLHSPMVSLAITPPQPATEPHNLHLLHLDQETLPITRRLRHSGTTNTKPNTSHLMALIIPILFRRTLAQRHILPLLQILLRITPTPRHNRTLTIRDTPNLTPIVMPHFTPLYRSNQGLPRTVRLNDALHRLEVA